MTKRWSSTASGDGKTKRQASKEARQHTDMTADDWMEIDGREWREYELSSPQGEMK